MSFSQNIPPLILSFCAALILLFAFLVVRMITESSRIHHAMRQLEGVFRAAERPDADENRNGLEPVRLADLRSKCRRLANPMKNWWSRIDDNLVRYVTAARVEEWYLGVPARNALAEESVFDRYYHSSFYQAVPGILTGLGLTGTFVAILVALASLHVSVIGDTETVTGISELIGGLSGKFLSSIVGLLLSMVFLFVERKSCERRLTEAYEDLLDSVSHLIPTMTPVRVQIETQALLSRQLEGLTGVGAMSRVSSPSNGQSNAFVGNLAATLATDVDLFANKLEELESALNRGIRQLAK
jgi:uncharacterized membrane protein